jgi:hypothetical protein
MARPKKTQPANGVVKVERGVPIPPERLPGRFPVYPWRDMEIGDSFAVDRARDRQVRSVAWGWGKRHGQKFTVARVVEDGIEKVRCWRIA